MEWPMVRLGDLVQEFISGGTPSSKIEHYWKGIVPWVTGADIDDNVVAAGRRWITQEAVDNSATHVVPKGAVLLVTRTGVGKVAKAGTDIAISQDLTGLVLKESVSADFVVVAIRHRMNSFLDIQQGATIKGILRKDVEDLVIPLPPPPNQRRIVEILDQADHLRRLRAEADTKADRILPALFLKMFGDPATNPMGWTVRPLGEISDHLTSGSRGWANYTGRGEAFFVRTQDIENGEISATLLRVDPPAGAESERTRLATGDVVIAITGVVGKAAVVRDNASDLYVSQHVALVRPRQSVLIPDYLAAYANLPLGDVPVLARSQYGQTKPGLGFREIRTALVQIPPIDLQSAFAGRVKALRQLRDSTERSRLALESLWNAILHRAFSASLTASWREEQMKELLQEMQQQTKALAEVAI